MKKSTKIKIVYTYVSERRWVHSNVATPEPEPEPVPNTPPVVTVVGDNPLEMTYGRPYPEYGATSYDAEDGDITDSIVTVNPVDANTAGTYVVTYYSTDSAGATTSATRSVVVAAAANTLPTIALVGLSALSIPNGGPYVEYGATASDVEDGDLTSSIVITSTVNVNVAGTYTVTYRVTDSGGASASVVRTVTVAAPVVNQSPTITLVGPSRVDLVFGGPYTEYGATASDPEDGNLTTSIATTSTVNVNVAGSYTVTYYVTDSGGLSASAVRTVVVAAAANALPTISLVGASSLSLSYGGPYIEYGATANDAEDGDLTSSIVITSTVNVNVAGSYTVTYQVTDSGGASASVTRTVTVAAYYNNPPTIALVGSSSLALPFGGPYVEYGATATDVEDGNITANIVTTSTVNVNVAGAYTVTYRITDSGGATASVVRSVTVAATVPTGYFFSPTGSAANTGTYESPWDVQSALATQVIPSGSTLYALPGLYTARPATGANSIASPEYPGQTENIYQVAQTGVTIKPYGATHSNPYPAIFEFGLQLIANDIVLEYLYCRNPTTIPVSEPTISGSPYPGHPAAAPAGWAYWGSGGTISISPLGQVDGITIRNCVMNGGAGGISSFNCTSLTLDGNIFFDIGWEAVDRHHGHCHYMRNGGQTNDPADRCYLTRCLISSSNQRLTTGSGSLTLYSQSEIVENFELTKSWVKGTSIVQSTQLYARNMEYADMVFEAAAIGDNFDNITFGRPTSADDDFTLTNLTVINARKLADTDNITNLTQTNIRQIKTRALYTRTAMDPGETGTFVNAYTTPTADEVYIWPLDDTTVLHVHILDLDLDGTVAVDLAGYATSVQSYLLFHYLDPRTVLASGSLSSSLILNLTVRETNPVNGLLDSTDAYIIRLIPS